ncbi:MAG: winged helix DNA-binding domain-containing protein [Dysgonamonadaceae bacterium]|jgi:hypothetical protein|nr:winged helix DNA-binding domain-containing protein [Dysgonamonadaceae bacterium]
MNLSGKNFENRTYFIHKSLKTDLHFADGLQLLPPFDEYIIAYRDRTAVKIWQSDNQTVY